MNRLVLRISAPAAMAALLILGLIGVSAAPTVAAGAGYRFHVYLPSSCVDGYGPPSTAFSLKVTDPDGKPMQMKAGNTDSNGLFDICFKREIDAGDTLYANDGLNHRTFKVPFLTASINRVSDVVRGRAPAGKTLGITGYHNPGLICCGFSFPQVTVKADKTGHFRRDLSSTVDLLGNDFVDVEYATPAGDIIHRTGYAPYFSVTVGDLSIGGIVTRGALVSFTERGKTGTLKGSARAIGQTSNGMFTTKLTNGFGAAVFVRTGDVATASFASDAKITVPPMALTGTQSTDVVSGKCRPSVPFLAYASNAVGNGYSYQGGTTAADGTLSADMSSGQYASFDLQSGDIIRLTCKSPAGDTVSLLRNVP